jgi:hypothetical protein
MEPALLLPEKSELRRGSGSLGIGHSCNFQLLLHGLQFVNRHADFYLTCNFLLDLRTLHVYS